VRTPDERHTLNTLTLPIVGNLTSDPELRFTAAGVAVARFMIAHNPRTFDKVANEWKDGEATFFDCSVWRDLAEHVAESLESGHRVIAIGNVRTTRFQSTGSGKTPAGETITRQQLDVFAIGPELTWATAAVKKATRTRSGEAAPDDPWATASKARPAAAAAAGAGSRFDDEPPF
jgi:single-strand DNA-binding protein